MTTQKPSTMRGLEIPVKKPLSDKILSDNFLGIEETMSAVIYYFQKLEEVVVFAKVQGPEGSADLWKNHSREKLKNVLVRKPGRKSYYCSHLYFVEISHSFHLNDQSGISI